MDCKKPIGGFSPGRLFCFLTGCIFFAVYFSAYFFRELWFDEALTLINFASLPSIPDIYRSYFIPNNQIVHTVFLHCMLKSGITPESMRIFPLLCGGGIILILWRNFARETGKKSLAITLAALVLSPPFMLYASALRGYMPAALFAVCGLAAAKRYALGGKKRNLLLWFIFCVLSVGVMPSALAGLAAAGLYVLPYCGKKFWKNRRVIFLALAPFAGFALFYLPIMDKLQKAFELNEGWHAPWYAVMTVFLTVGITFFVPLTGGMFFHRPKWRDLPRTVIWLLPLGSLLLPTAPFPRVWFVLFPFFALLTAGFLRRMPDKWIKVCAAAVLLWSGISLTGTVKSALSPVCSLAGQDDFYAPYFVRKEFMPSDTAYFVNSKFSGGVPLFAAFDADPWALMCYYPGQVQFDSPRGRVIYMPDNSVFVLAAAEEKENYENRFGGRLDEIYSNGFHKVYLLRKEQ